MGGREASCKFKKAARKLFLRTCLCFRRDPAAGAIAASVHCDSSHKETISCEKNPSEISGSGKSGNKSLCAICLDPLNYSSGGSAGQAIFTAQCSHAFHFSCISSNVQHGSVTCPICRAQWTQLPRNLNIRCASPLNKTDPVLQILDASIADSRLNRRSFLRSARYDDDDPLDPDQTSNQPCFQFSVTGPWNRDGSCYCSGSYSIAGSPIYLEAPFQCSPSTMAYLRLRLGYRPSTDLVLVANSDEHHLRVMKQAMALVVFSLQAGDRLAIVTCSSSATRVFPLRRMTPFGKKSALQVIDRLFFHGEGDPTEGLSKGVKILADRIHKNTQSSVLHLTNGAARSHHLPAIAIADCEIRIRRFHLGFGFGAALHEFEAFIGKSLSGSIRDVVLRIKESCRIIRIGEMCGGEERRIPIWGEEFWPLHVSYSYVDGGGLVRMGETVVGLGEEGDGSENAETAAAAMTRMSSGEGWDWYHHDPFMARRWAKYLHGH